MNNSVFDKSRPFLASIKERYLLSKPGSNKFTYHLVLDLSGSSLLYHIGDSIAIYPINDPEAAEFTLSYLRVSGAECVTHRTVKETISLKNLLLSKVNISQTPKKVLQLLAERQPNPTKKDYLFTLLKDENKETLKGYLTETELWATLEQHQEVSCSIQEIVDALPPLLPRFYSIASSPKVVGDEVHLTIALVKYQQGQRIRNGVCTNYLCNLAPLNEPVVPVYIQPHHGFTLPHDDQIPIIMVGPGTGVAPFRAFMQERIAKNAPGPNWLFFGEWTRQHDFLYEHFWYELQQQGVLKLNTAFSREQPQKVYVQHHMVEHGEELFRWINEGAHFYVCGDANRMAKDVEATLQQIIQEYGKLDHDGAKAYVKNLRTSKRYLRDVY